MTSSLSYYISIQFPNAFAVLIAHFKSSLIHKVNDGSIQSKIGNKAGRSLGRGYLVIEEWLAWLLPPILSQIISQWPTSRSNLVLFCLQNKMATAVMPELRLRSTSLFNFRHFPLNIMFVSVSIASCRINK